MTSCVTSVGVIPLSPGKMLVGGFFAGKKTTRYAAEVSLARAAELTIPQADNTDNASELDLALQRLVCWRNGESLDLCLDTVPDKDGVLRLRVGARVEEKTIVDGSYPQSPVQLWRKGRDGQPRGKVLEHWCRHWC